MGATTRKAPGPAAGAATVRRRRGGRDPAPDRYQTSFYTYRHYRTVAAQNHDPRIAEFLLACCRRFGRRPVRDGLELACGPALLSMDLAARGVAMTAVDRCAAMLTFARRQARARGLKLAAVRADMIGYRAPHLMDLVFCLGPSTSHVLTNGEMLVMLAAVRDSLRPGALFIVDFDFVPDLMLRTPSGGAHPWLRFDAGPAYVARAQDGKTEVELRFGVGPSRYDPVRQLFQSHNEIVLRRGGRKQTHRSPSVGKLYFPLEIRSLVAQTSGLEVVGCFSTYALDAPDDLGGDRYVVVIRRSSQRAGG